MIIVIIFFSFFFFTGSTDPAACGSAGQALRSADPLALGCSQALRSAPSAQGWADQASGGCSLRYDKACVASPTPRPNSQAPGVRNPMGVPPTYWVLPSDPMLLGPAGGLISFWS
jgi:hypothetical protein